MDLLDEQRREAREADLREAYEQANEIEAQYRFEVGLFGDACREAQAHLDSIRTYIRDRELEVGILREARRQKGRSRAAFDEDDISF